jgi:hypothetical protein
MIFNCCNSKKKFYIQDCVGYPNLFGWGYIEYEKVYQAKFKRWPIQCMRQRVTYPCELQICCVCRWLRLDEHGSAIQQARVLAGCVVWCHRAEGCCCCVLSTAGTWHLSKCLSINQRVLKVSNFKWSIKSKFKVLYAAAQTLASQTAKWTVDIGLGL